MFVVCVVVVGVVGHVCRSHTAHTLHKCCLFQMTGRFFFSSFSFPYKILTRDILNNLSFKPQFHLSHIITSLIIAHTCTNVYTPLSPYRFFFPFTNCRCHHHHLQLSLTFVRDRHTFTNHQIHIHKTTNWLSGSIVN